MNAENEKLPLVYADNNATTPVAEEVYRAMEPYLTRDWFNPSSMYDQAQDAANAVAVAREQVGHLLGGVSKEEVVFTSCATESNNTAIRGVLAAAGGSRRHVITTEVEHPAVLEVCHAMQRQGYEVTYLPVDQNGNLDIADYVKALRSDTALVTIMHANNETGVIFPVGELARIAKETDPSIVFHTDATQSPGKIPLDLSGDMQNIDLLSLSGHKLHAPKGVGVLFLRRGTRCRPLMIGGHQERGFRAGTENVPHIVGMGKACELVEEKAGEEACVAELRDRLEKGLLERIPCVQVNGGDAPRLPNTSNLACLYVEGESILYQLSAQGVCISTGSACSSGSLEPSHVLKAMQVPFTGLHGSVRFSLSRYNNARDVDRLLEVFPQVIASLRRLSP